jgi:hypothetical protein
MSRDTGGPAFPTTQYVNGISPSGHNVGMTLRDYFAAKAMQALTQKYSHEGDISRNAYKIADAMLRAGEK